MAARCEWQKRLLPHGYHAYTLLCTYRGTQPQVLVDSLVHDRLTSTSEKIGIGKFLVSVSVQRLKRLIPVLTKYPRSIRDVAVEDDDWFLQKQEAPTRRPGTTRSSILSGVAQVVFQM